MFKLKHLFCGLFLILGLSFTLEANLYEFFLNPYVGVEGAWRHWPWDAEFGERHFKENYMNHNGVIGLQFHTFFAIEAGYQTTDRQQKQKFYNGDGFTAEPVLGFLRPFGDRAPVLHIAEARMSGPHINLIGLLPILNATTLYASLGVAWMRFYVSTVGINDDVANIVSIPVTR
ncbi:MAG TPA: hypothetical protein VFP93_00170, partial [Gammaproteobacteria bacterium]|nr:hypothetical protein [Gammaproteobacteria bacterium]